MKHIVLDTSVLLSDPAVLESIHDAYIYIPLTVLSELDSKKNKLDTIGKNARDVANYLAQFQDKGNFYEGIPDKEKNTVIRFVIENLNHLPDSLSKGKADNCILSVCLTIQKKLKAEESDDQIEKEEVTLVTNDTYLGLIAAGCGIKHEAFRGELATLTGYTGYQLLKERGDEFKELREGKPIDFDNKRRLNENQYGLVDKKPGKGSLYVRHSNKKLLPIRLDYSGFNITPKNKIQKFLFDALLDKNIQFVTVTGPAGSGKTLVSVALGLEQVIGTDPVYKRILMSRSLEPLGGRDKIGFLKGSLDDKLGPWIRPMLDALDHYFGDKSTAMYNNLVNQKKLEIEPLQYIRGRSINDSYFIVDEAQNLTKKEIKTIVTRMGTNSKLILLGDTDQIDSPYLTKDSNGLSQAVESFKTSPIAAHLELVEGVRSPLATEGAKRL